jgi:hypothetical protein
MEGTARPEDRRKNNDVQQQVEEAQVCGGTIGRSDIKSIDAKF